MCALAVGFPPSTSGAGESVLYHYTDYFGLSGIVGSKSIWCSKIQHLNDFSELTHGFNVLNRVLKNEFASALNLPDLDARIGQITGCNIFSCSFSERGDILSQWRGYSGGNGVSIGFSYEKLQAQAALSGFRLVKCVYDDEEKVSIARDHLKIITKNSKIASFEDLGWYIVSSFLYVAASFKDRSFQEEQEWRIVSPLINSQEGSLLVRPLVSGLMPYIKFNLLNGGDTKNLNAHSDICISEVVVGPNREQELQMQAVMYLFDSLNVKLHSCSSSNIPFRQL